MAGTACGENDAGTNGNMTLPVVAGLAVMARIEEITGGTPVLR